jgi:hypothetical protein
MFGFLWRQPIPIKTLKAEKTQDDLEMQRAINNHTKIESALADSKSKEIPVTIVDKFEYTILAKNSVIKTEDKEIVLGRIMVPYMMYVDYDIGIYKADIIRKLNSEAKVEEITIPKAAIQVFRIRMDVEKKEKSRPDEKTGVYWFVDKIVGLETKVEPELLLKSDKEAVEMVKEKLKTQKSEWLAGNGKDTYFEMAYQNAIAETKTMLSELGIKENEYKIKIE